MRGILALALVTGLATIPIGAAPPGVAVSITPSGDGSHDVKFGDRLFTTLHTKGFPKPILYPLIGPHGIRFTRDYPMSASTPGEEKDHPHHQSLWFTHGSVNGVDYWALGKGTIVTETVHPPEMREGEASLTLEDRWVQPDGRTALRDTLRLVFHAPVLVGGEELIALDYEITLRATEEKVVFGDTKEGTLGIRTHPALQLNRGASALNSEGVTGKDVWGKRARWIDYSAAIEGKTVGVAILDHPSNLRHPTWWHARDYGLVAANPFGVHDFEGKPDGAGRYELEKGTSLTLKYRFLFHGGDAAAIDVERRHKEWAGQAAAPGPVPLFDGKTLAGWVQKGGNARYSVADGMIVGESVPGSPNSFLVTTSEFADFVLEYDFLCDPELNSGVQIRSSAFSQPRTYEVGGKKVEVPANRVHGYQVEIDPNQPERAWVGGIYDEGRRGWLYPGAGGGDAAKFSEQGKRLYRKGDWNHVRVEAVGPSIKTWLNGELRAELTDQLTPRGFIALQVHGVGDRKEPLRVRWKNLRIEPRG